MLQLKSTLTNPKQTQFIVVTIPTSMAVEESKRLISGLGEAGEVRAMTIGARTVPRAAADGGGAAAPAGNGASNAQAEGG
jgi:anion-transporting  ArsA/GET3 family ATPase